MSVQQSALSTEIDEAIRHITGVTGANRVALAGYIGRFCGETEVEWRFEKDGRRSRFLLMPRAAFTYVREYDRKSGGLVNFWLVEMARPMAEYFGISEFILSNEEANAHRDRINGKLKTEN